MENFEIKRLIATFLNKKLYIILALLVSLTVGYFYTYYYKTPMYEASTTMLLVKGETEETNDTSTITQSDIALNQKLVSTYTQIIKSNKILRKTISNLNLNLTEAQLYNNVSVTSEDDTEIIRLSVVNSNPEIATKIANEIANIFSVEVKELYNIDNVNVIDKAETPIEPYNVNHIKDLIMSCIIGISISCAFIFIYYIFNKTIKLEEDVEEYTGLNVLTTIPLYGKNIKLTAKTEKEENNNIYKELITFEDSKSPIAECFRTLRTNLLFTQTEKVIKTILVTSGYMKEGKSWTSANMAVAFAKSNKKVLLVDTDMRKGRQHHIFKVDNNIGLSNCLTVTENNENIEIDNLSKYIKETQIPNIHIMTSGNRPPNPSELISSKKMEELLNILKDMYDIVILDGSPSMVVSDSIILSKLVDSTVIVTANKETKIETLQKLQRALEAIDAKIAGVVINKMEVSMQTYNNKYYYAESSQKKEENEENILENVEIETVQEIINKYKNRDFNIIKLEEENNSDNRELYNSKLEDEIIKKIENKLNSLTTNFTTEDIENKLEELKTDIQILNKEEQLEDLKKKLEKISNTIEEQTNKQTLDIEAIQKKSENLINQYQDIINMKLEKYMSNIDETIKDKLKNIKINLSNEEKNKNIEEEIYNMQNLIISSIIDNNNEEIEEKIKLILNNTENQIALKEVEIRNNEENIETLQNEISIIKKEISSIKEILTNNSNNSTNQRKIVDIEDLKENKIPIKFFNKKITEEYSYDIHQELRSEDLAKPINNFSQILNPSNTKHIAN